MGYFELPEEDVPDEAIWLDQEAIADHFHQVRQRYADKRAGHLGATEAVPDAGPIEQNDLTMGWR